jgi:hypothetical protein
MAQNDYVFPYIVGEIPYKLYKNYENFFSIQIFKVIEKNKTSGRLSTGGNFLYSFCTHKYISPVFL